MRRSARTRRLVARGSRYLLLSAVGIVAAVGVREMVAPREAAPAAAPLAPADRGAESYALRLARAYLTYDAARPQRRDRVLEPLLPEEFAPDGGFIARRGSRSVLWAEIAASASVAGGERSIVVAAKTDVEPEPVYLAVRVRRDRTGALQLTGYPAVVGAAAVSRGPLPELSEVEDRDVAEVGRRVVANYLAGERANLRADLLPGSEVSLPALPLRVREVLEVSWAEGEGGSQIAVTVEARDPEGSLYTLGYELGIERRGGRPLVSFIETVPTDPMRRDR